jgi:hypothetical protein
MAVLSVGPRGGDGIAWHWIPATVQGLRLIAAPRTANDCSVICSAARGNGLDAIEKAIRNAFEKGDPLDAAFRDKVYRSVLAALERSLASQNISAEAAESRRAGVRARIEEIETEFVPAIEADRFPDRAAPAVWPERETTVAAAPPHSAPGPDEEFLIEPPARTTPAAELGLDMADADFDRRRARSRKPGRSRSWGGPLSVVVVLLLAGAGIWWTVASGFFGSPGVVATGPDRPTESADTGVDTTPAPLGEIAPTRDWITVFSPDDTTLVSAPGDAQADLMEDESGKFLRIRTSANGTPVTFDVGQGLLERIAGRRAVFDIIARAEGDEPTQISVDCNLGELGNCGRKRYAVDYERREFLFELDLPDQRPRGGGTISIISDIANRGKAVDIYELRVSLAR